MRWVFLSRQRTIPSSLRRSIDLASRCLWRHAMHEFRVMRHIRFTAALFAATTVTACSWAGSMSEAQGSMSSSCEFARVYQSNSVVGLQTESPGAAGYQWFPELPQNVRLIEMGVLPPSSLPGSVGAPATQWWRFEIANGSTKQTTVDFFLYQVLEGKEKAIRHCAVELTRR